MITIQYRAHYRYYIWALIDESMKFSVIQSGTSIFQNTDSVLGES